MTSSSSWVIFALNTFQVRYCAGSEVTPIDKPIKPTIKVQDSINNAKVYCQQNPDSFVSLRDFSDGIYNQTCTDFAAAQRASDPNYKIGSD